MAKSLAFLMLATVIVSIATSAQDNKHGGFALRLVDDRLANNQAPPGDDRVPVSGPGKGLPQALWLKRDGVIAGDVLLDALTDIDAVSRQPIVRIHLTPSASEQFALLTKANVGHRVAVIINGVVVAAPVVVTPILNGTVVVTGMSTDQAQTLVAEMMGTKPLKP